VFLRVMQAKAFPIVLGLVKAITDHLLGFLLAEDVRVGALVEIQIGWPVAAGKHIRLGTLPRIVQ
jgi:hypothetical protein